MKLSEKSFQSVFLTTIKFLSQMGSFGRTWRFWGDSLCVKSRFLILKISIIIRNPVEHEKCDKKSRPKLQNFFRLKI